jgi:hypothetical protein
MAPSSDWLRPDPSAEFGMHMKEVVLDKVRLGSRIAMDAQIWSDMRMNVSNAMDTLADQVVFQFETTVFQEKLPPQTITKRVEWCKDVVVEIQQPKSPWQFLKERARCSRWWYWLFKYLPEPVYTTFKHSKQICESQDITLDLHHSVIYPEAKAIASPDMGSVRIRWVEPVWK